MHSGALSGRATTAPCSGRGNGARRYGWGRPARPDVGARLARRPTLIRATGRSSLSRYRERYPDKSVEQRCQEGNVLNQIADADSPTRKALGSEPDGGKLTGADTRTAITGVPGEILIFVTP